MIRKSMMGAMLTVVALAGCQTSQEAARNMQNRWIGMPADSFFVENGPPVSTFQRDNGGEIYTWRGGEKTSVTPAQFRSTVQPAKPSIHDRGYTAPRPTVVTTYQPERRYDYVCEAQIVADAQGIIEAVRISRDTDGVGLSFSRCAELFAQ